MSPISFFKLNINDTSIKSFIHSFVQQKATLMYKIINGFSPNYLNELFTYVNQTYNHNLRMSEVNVKIPAPKSEHLKRSLMYSGAVLWNKLPSMIKKASSVNNFKNLINFHFFNLLL